MGVNKGSLIFQVRVEWVSIKAAIAQMIVIISNKHGDDDDLGSQL